MINLYLFLFIRRLIIDLEKNVISSFTLYFAFKNEHLRNCYERFMTDAFTRFNLSTKLLTLNQYKMPINENLETKLLLTNKRLIEQMVNIQEESKKKFQYFLDTSPIFDDPKKTIQILEKKNLELKQNVKEFYNIKIDHIPIVNLIPCNKIEFLNNATNVEQLNSKLIDYKPGNGVLISILKIFLTQKPNEKINEKVDSDFFPTVERFKSAFNYSSGTFNRAEAEQFRNWLYKMAYYYENFEDNTDKKIDNLLDIIINQLLLYYKNNETDDIYVMPELVMFKKSKEFMSKNKIYKIYLILRYGPLLNKYIRI